MTQALPRATGDRSEFPPPTLRLGKVGRGMIPTVLAPVVAAGLVAGIQRLGLGDFRRVLLLAVFGTAGLLGFFILANWRIGVVVFVVWIVFEDLLRKSLGNELLLYAVKDVIVLLTYGGYWLKRMVTKSDGFRNPLKVPLLLWFGWAVSQMLSGSTGTVAVPLVGLRMSFFYVPMLYLGYEFVRTEKDLRTFLVLALTVAAGVAALGIAQSIIGLQFLNPSDPSPFLRLYETRTSPVSGLYVPRVTAVFVDPGRFSQYLFVALFVGLGTLGCLRSLRTPVGVVLRRWSLLCWLVVIGGLFVSGQRAVIVWMVVAPLALLLLHLRGRGWVRGGATRWMRFVVAAIIGLVAFSAIFPLRFEAASRLYRETLNPAASRDVFSRQAGYWDDVVRSFSLFGHGTGTASLGLQYVAAHSPGAAIEESVEGGYAGVLWEWGVVGLALWLWWSLSLVRCLWRASMKVAGTPYHLFSIGMLLYAFFLLFPWFFLGFQIYQQYVAQAFLWLFAGMALKLPVLADQERKRNEPSSAGAFAT